MSTLCRWDLGIDLPISNYTLCITIAYRNMWKPKEFIQILCTSMIQMVSSPENPTKPNLTLTHTPQTNLRK